MDRNDLISKIVRLCQLDSRPVIVRIAELLGYPVSNTEETAGPDTLLATKEAPVRRKTELFQIQRKGQPLRITSQQEYDEYVSKIQNMRELELFLERYDGKPGCKTYVQLAEKLIQSVRKYMPPGYDTEENDAERLAEYVDKRILKTHVKKISKAAFRAFHAGEKTEPSKVLMLALNAYLKRLGVYTVAVQPGDSYSSVIDYYEAVNRDPSEDEILEMDYPAYVLEFLDEEKSLAKYTLPGRCFLKARELCEYC